MTTSSNSAEKPAGGRSVVYLPTVAAYDRWAEVYDTDNNMLQAVDTQEIPTLLRTFFSRLEFIDSVGGRRRLVRIVDLGCGTGRNTLKLLEGEEEQHRQQEENPDVVIVGLDASPKMLEIAKQKCEEAVVASLAGDGKRQRQRPQVTFEVFDAIAVEKEDALPPVAAREADGVISTLVLEHLPLRTFFRTVAKMLRVGGHLLLTNMHADMGAQSQAGFVDPVTGEKIRPTSFVYGVEEVLQVAGEWGMRLVEEVQERKVEASDVEHLGARSKKWVGTTVWFGMIFVKFEDHV